MLVFSDSRNNAEQRMDKKTTTAPVTLPSLPNIPVSPSDVTLDEHACPSHCIPVNSCHKSSVAESSLHHRDNQSVNTLLSPTTRAPCAVGRHSKRHPFDGFCRCRDLGLLRICQRCPAWKT